MHHGKENMPITKFLIVVLVLRLCVCAKILLIFTVMRDHQLHARLKLNTQHQCLRKIIKAHGDMSYKFHMKVILHKPLK